MTKLTRRTIAKGLGDTALSPLARPALAQSAWLAAGSQIKVIVPYPAGGATDVIGRIISKRLSIMWNATCVVENVVGAAANIGMDRAAKGPSDGSQILIPATADLDQSVPYAKMRFDPKRI